MVGRERETIVSDFTDDVDWYDGEEEEEWDEYTAILITQTKKAWLLNFGEGRPQVWLPKSQIERVGNCTWLIPEWLAGKAGLLI